jgi:hypothetical protein
MLQLLVLLLLPPLLLPLLLALLPVLAVLLGAGLPCLSLDKGCLRPKGLLAPPKVAPATFTASCRILLLPGWLGLLLLAATGLLLLGAARPSAQQGTCQAGC